MRNLSFLRSALGVASLLAATGGQAAGPVPRPGPTNEIVLTQALAIPSVGRYGRFAVHTDAIEAAIVGGRWSLPKAGDQVQGPDGKMRTWEVLNADTNGWFGGRTLRGGYADIGVDSTVGHAMILEASGDGMVYVNGVPRGGDPYAYGYVHLPVWLAPGRNDFLFHCPRGRFQAKLVPPPAPVCFNLGDTTLPDLIVGESRAVVGAVVVINATTDIVDHLEVEASGPRSGPAQRFPFSLPPLSVRKAAFALATPPPRVAGSYEVRLQVVRDERGHRMVLNRAQVRLRVRPRGQVYKRTFLSDIDDSVQYYAVNPAHPVGRAVRSLALFLSLHGAGVEAVGQAEAYSPKRWGTIVCPTNRRPYGFDWEDWGRLDALEVLSLAQQELRPDPQRIYLTGHSMGGHGTWQLGAIFPDHFAAIGASAGWISFRSYVETNYVTPAGPIADLLRRAAAASDTLLMATNYLQEGIYILHGSADDNVPVREARTMAARLSRFHHDFVYHEEPGVGHWWDRSDEPGTDCVDWAPMFDFFARHDIPADDSLRRIRFVTVNPGISARSHWLTIDAQIHPLEPSVVDVRVDPGKRRFVGTTENVARLALDLAILPPGEPLSVELDGQKLAGLAWPKPPPWWLKRASTKPTLWLERHGATWVATAPPRPELKGPRRLGPFKEAFRNHMLFVYGTQGTAAENAWALAKARYDAEVFWYRGNGSVQVMSDLAYLWFRKTATNTRSYEPNVILYGHAQSNAAWKPLLADSPVQVRRGAIRIGDRTLSGDDLACLFVRPMPHNDTALIGVVSGSGLPGLRLTDRLPYFISGLDYPDCTVIGPEMLTQGLAGVRAAGFFGEDWGVADGEFAWK